MRTEFLPFHLPQIGPEEEAGVLRVLRSGWLTTGPEAKAFEAEFAAAVGARHAVAVNSCTAALHLALEAAGVGAGDEVIVPTMTFAASAEVVTYLGARPVLVDCDPDTLTLSPDAVARSCSPFTKVIMPVHFAGHPCDMDRILAIAGARGLTVVEDAAHCLPATYRGRSVGAIGDTTCFSFYATKTITTGEGGMLTTDDAATADRARMMSLHGISRDAWKRYTAEGSWYYEIIEPGFKYNLTDVAAAIGRAQLAKRQRFLEARARIAQRYTSAFGDLVELQLPVCRGDVGHSWHLYVIRIRPERLLISRDRFIELLKEQGIGTSVHFIPLHQHPFYRSRFGYKPSDYPHASEAYARAISLPIYPRMSDDDVTRVIGAVRRIAIEQRRPSFVGAAQVQ